MTWEIFSKRLATGFILLFLGVAIKKFQPYEYIFSKMSIINPDGITYHFWSQADVHLITKVYIFNITNKDAFLAGKEKLKLQEVGPYVYREEAIHHNVTFDHENGTVFSNPRYTLHWEPNLNQREETEKLMLPHIAMLVFCSKFSYLKMPLNAFITSTNSSPIVEQSVKEFLFGYDNAFITVGNSLLPFWIKFQKIGILDRLYDHEEDVATTYTGELDTHKTGLFATYNGASVLAHWNEPCNSIGGTSDGKKFGNDKGTDETLHFYRKGICRAIPLRRDRPDTVTTFGIPTYSYKFEENMFDNGEFNEKNKCFCKRTPCWPNTIQEISDCFYGFPVGLSFPHFLNGSDSLREPFEGLHPDLQKHDTNVLINPGEEVYCREFYFLVLILVIQFFLLEDAVVPGLNYSIYSGLSYACYIANGHVKFQINALLDDLSGISEADKFSNMILPLAWADFTVEQTETKVNILLFLSVRLLPALETILAFSFIFIGIFLTMYHMRDVFRQQCGFNLIRNKTKRKIRRLDENEPNVQHEQLHSLMDKA